MKIILIIVFVIGSCLLVNKIFPPTDAGSEFVNALLWLIILVFGFWLGTQTTTKKKGDS
jgi:di/tricarboxylate transporter